MEIFNIDDFIIVKGEGPGVIFQIKNIKTQVFSYNVLRENMILTCQKYLHNESLNSNNLKTFYINEYFQTDMFQEITANNIAAIVSVLKEPEYLSLRYTQFPEDRVFVCRWKFREKQLIPVEDLNNNYTVFNDIMFIQNFRCFKVKILSLQFFNTEFSLNLEIIKNEKLEISTDISFGKNTKNESSEFCVL